MTQESLFSGVGGCGVYSIKNITNNQEYIGSSINIRKRLTAHLSLLNNGKHTNVKLQRSYDKYSVNNFSFCVLRLCGQTDLENFEQEWCEKNVPFFNIRKIIKSNYGTKLSEETKLRMSKAKKGKPLNEKQKIHLSNIQNRRKGIPVLGKVKESLKLGSLASVGIKRSKETKDKISQSKIGKKFDRITRKYI